MVFCTQKIGSQVSLKQTKCFRQNTFEWQHFKRRNFDVNILNSCHQCFHYWLEMNAFLTHVFKHKDKGLLSAEDRI